MVIFFLDGIRKFKYFNPRRLSFKIADMINFRNFLVSFIVLEFRRKDFPSGILKNLMVYIFTKVHFI